MPSSRTVAVWSAYRSGSMSGWSVEVVEHGVDQALVCDGEQVWVEVNPIGMIRGVPSLAT